MSLKKLAWSLLEAFGAAAEAMYPVPPYAEPERENSKERPDAERRERRGGEASAKRPDDKPPAPGA
jgi:hypothetical protein